MAADAKRTVAPGAGEKGISTAEGKAESVSDDACRCEETSNMTPRELLGLMMKDLAFWKRTKKE